MGDLEKIFVEEVFSCTKCNSSHNNRKFMNPYKDINKKIEQSGSKGYKNRQKYFLEYVRALTNIQIMIIGLAPGLDGCGFSGIPFTAEKNAISDLGFKNYHKSCEPYQTEDSANFIYALFERVANFKRVTIKELLERIYITNSCLCVPLKESEVAIDNPTQFMMNRCGDYLKRQIQAVKPNTVIVFGTLAYQNLIKLLRPEVIKKELPKLTECVERRSTFKINGIEIIPEIHPSPQNKRNHCSQLYETSPERLFEYLIDSIY